MLKKEFYTREEYFAYDALDYTYLKNYDKDPNASRESNLSGQGVTFGSAVDCLLFDGKEEFDRQYAYIGENKPTASSLVLLESVLQDVKDFGFETSDITNEYLVKKIKDLGLWTSVKSDDKLLSKLTPEFMFYLMKSIEYKNKIILDQETYEKVSTACNYIMTVPHTSKYFEDYETETQLAFSFTKEEFGDMEFKAMLDLVCIDHENKKIIPIDLKTMSDPVLQFKANVIKYGYYLQAELYTMAIKEWADSKGMSEYEIMPFMYIVSSSADVSHPYVYKLNNVKKFIERLNETSPFYTKNIRQIIMNYKASKKYGFEFTPDIHENGYIEL